MSYFRINDKNSSEFSDCKNKCCANTTKIYLYLGLYNVLLGTFTSGLPL